MADKPSFKSVGKTQSEIQEIALHRRVSLPPVGIRTPLALGDTDLFVMHTSLASQIRDNLRNLVLTNHGERLGLHDFGANLRPLATELTAREDFEAEAMARIRSTVSKYMPFVQLQTFELTSANEQIQHTGKIRIRMTYSAPIADLLEQILEVTVYVI